VLLAMNDFVFVKDDVYSAEFCASVIAYYERMVDSGFGLSRKVEGVSRTKKDDVTVFPTEANLIDLSATATVFKKFSDDFWGHCYREYADQFDILAELENHTIYSARIQKTKIGGGYHVWHCENTNRRSSGRFLAYTVYLNDVCEGGETEFLYYPKRVKPKAGSVMIFPSGFTHTHRGNPPISNEKYIITGWIEF
jgi:hypothetical protein